MRNVLSIAVVGLLASASFAQASTTEARPVPGPTLTPVYGIKYFCEFEGRGVGSGNFHQDRNVRCRAEGILGSIMTASSVDTNAVATPSIPGGPIEIRCSNGYKLETDYTAIAAQGGTLWINAERHDKLATIRVEDFFAPAAQNESERRFKADLIAANSSVIHGEGHCKFKYPSPPPVPSLSE